MATFDVELRSPSSTFNIVLSGGGGAGGTSQITATTGSPTILENITFNGVLGQTFVWGTGGGSFTPVAGAPVYYLAVAGGGGGGIGYDSGAFGGGGGGAGGLLGGTALSSFTASASSYSVIVGTGGAAGTITTAPANGTNSDITLSGSSVIGGPAIGGGAGGYYLNNNAQGIGSSGGSGGGGSTWGGSNSGGAGTSGQGNAGGSSFSGGASGDGGGGGAGSVGEDGSDTKGGDGGAGISSSIKGSPTFYAGGGAGSTKTTPAPTTVVTVFLTSTGAGAWTVPADCTSATIHVIGGGGGGGNGNASDGSSGGGGGGYSSSVLALTPGSSVNYSIGTGGSAGVAGADTWFSSSTTLMAKGGLAGGNNVTSVSASFSRGGQAADGFGDIKWNGGNGGVLITTGADGGAGGGGAGGPTQAGGTGNLGQLTNGGSGGTSLGAGGSTIAGGTAGAGAAGAGNNGDYWTDGVTSVGPGSGGGGGARNFTGAAGGFYGAGGGGGGRDGTSGGAGRQGLIVIEYASSNNIVFEDYVSGTQAGAGNLTINYPATVNADDFLIGVAGVISTTTLSAPASGWNDLGQHLNGSVQGRFAWRKAVGNEDGTSTTWACASSQDKFGLIARYSGVDPNSTIDAIGTSVSDNAEPYEASVTTTSPNTTVILMMSIDGAGTVLDPDATFTGTGGITVRGRTYIGGDLVVIGDAFFPTAGTHTVGFTSDAAGNDARSASLLAVGIRQVSLGGGVGGIGGGGDVGANGVDGLGGGGGGGDGRDGAGTSTAGRGGDGTVAIFVPYAGTNDGYIKVWNGSSWDLKPVKVWNGSSWQIKPVKFYNGSTWVLA